MNLVIIRSKTVSKFNIQFILYNFSIAKALLIKEGIETTKHSGVTSFFGQYIVKGKGFDKKIYKYLTRAKTSRKQADYDYDYVLDEDDAKEYMNMH